MEWHYTRTQLDIEATVVAQAVTPGTQVRRLYRRGVVGKAVLYLVLYVLLLRLVGPQMGENWLLLPVCLMVCVLAACLLTMPVRRYAKGQLRRFQKEHLLEGLLGAHTVTLDEEAGELRTAHDASASAGSIWRCPLAQLERAQSVCGGVLVTCQDGRSCFVPPTAFGGAAGMEQAIGEINAAIARAKAAPPRADTAGDTVPLGYTATPEGCTLRFTLDTAQAQRLLRQLTAALYRRPATYRRNWWLWAFFLVMFCYQLWVFWPLAVVMVLLVVGVIVWSARDPRQLAGLLGEMTLELTATELRTATRSGSLCCPYSRYYDVAETKDGIFPLSSEDGGALLIPKSAFADMREQQAFCQLLAARIRAGGGQGRP